MTRRLAALTALAALALAACAKEPPMANPPAAPATAPTAEPGPAGLPTAPAATPTAPTARTLADLKAHQGVPVRIEGTFRFPTEKAFARNKLALDDGTTVILPRPETGPGAAELTAANTGKRMAVHGVVYVEVIPDRYQIIGRTPDPYLVELAGVELLAP